MSTTNSTDDAATDSKERVPDSQTQIENLQRRAHTLLAEFQSFQRYLERHQKNKEVEFRTFRTNLLTEVRRLDDVVGSTLGVGSGNVGENTKYGRDMDGKEVKPARGCAKGGMHDSDYKARKSSHDNPCHGRVRQYETDNPDPVDEQAERKRAALLRSSNLPFWESVWATAKGCRGITALGKRVYVPEDVSMSKQGRDGLGNERRRRAATVDIVARDGGEWIKISTTSQRRLLFDMAKEGWAGSSSDEEDSNDEAQTSAGSREGMKLELVQLAEDLVFASRSQRVRHRHPLVRFVLSRLGEGVVDEIDAVIRAMRDQGATVDCAGQPPFITPPPADDDLWASMTPSSKVPSLTNTLNIDCTILLALISDISHYPMANLPPPDQRFKSYHSAILAQIKAEQVSPMLPTEVYPVLGKRRLVCSLQAEERMREIVNTMGTESERERADLIFARSKYHALGRDELCEHFRRLSFHGAPAGLSFPIEIYPYEGTTKEFSVDGKANEQILEKLTFRLRLSPINASVFLGGWIRNEVILTSNRVVASALEKAIDGLLNQIEKEGGEPIEEFEGPHIHVCKSARSLVGKSKANPIQCVEGD